MFSFSSWVWFSFWWVYLFVFGVWVLFLGGLVFGVWGLGLVLGFSFISFFLWGGGVCKIRNPLAFPCAP